MTASHNVLADGRLDRLPRFEPVRTHEDGERLYATPFGQAHSVTTILSGSRDNSGLEEWRESVGIERADFISSFACFRGNQHHLNIERWLTDGTEPPSASPPRRTGSPPGPSSTPSSSPCCSKARCGIPTATPAPWTPFATWPKTVRSPRCSTGRQQIPRESLDKLYDYSVQCAAYVAAANHVYADYGLNITQAKIVVAIADSTPQIETLDADALQQLYRHFLARKQRFTHARSRR